MPLEDVAYNTVTSRLEDLVQWARKRSIWPDAGAHYMTGLDVPA